MNFIAGGAMRRSAGIILGLLVLACAGAGALYWMGLRDSEPAPTPPPVAEVLPDAAAQRAAAERAWVRGNAAMDRGAFAEAVTAYDAAIGEDVSYALAYLSRGNARLALQEYDAAIADYGMALDHDHDLAEAYLARAMTHWLRGQLAEATEDFRQLALMRPENAFYVRRYGFALYEMGRDQEGDAVFRDAYRNDSSRTWALETWLATLGGRGAWSEMLTEAQGLYDSGITTLAVRTAVGEAHFGLGQFDQAIAWLAPVANEAATEVSTDAIGHLATAYQRTGQIASCRTALESYMTRMGRHHEYDPASCGQETTS